MSIKDDVNYVKQELSSDEKVLESALKVETVYKKHKIKIWVLSAVVVLFFIGKSVMTSVEQMTLEEANEALYTLKSNPEDASALQTLQSKNPALYEIYRYAQAVEQKDTASLQTLAKSQNSVIADSSSYALATIEEKATDSNLYREMALLNDAYLLIEAGQMGEAKEKLQLIDDQSPLAAIAKLLAHATIKGTK